MSDIRARRMVVIEQGAYGTKKVGGYMERGYGIIMIPDLSRIPRSSAADFLAVTADEVQEFLEDNQEVILLEGRRPRWLPLLDRELARRNLAVKKVRLT